MERDVLREPDEAAFRALARSSPWLWSTLRFVRRESWPDVDDRSRRGGAGVRAWLRRPDLLRVEDLDGELLRAVREEPGASSSWIGDGPPPDDEPVRRPDGLVRRRPWGLDADAPMFGGYQWVAMLDPVELADGRPDDLGRSTPGTRLTDLGASEHHGRPVWDALVTPTDEYDPRCPCCPLLLHTETAMPPPPEVARAEAHHVRLDVATGVCVHVRQIGGTHDGWTLDVAIEEVDQPIDDTLFAPARPPRLGS